MKLKQLGAVALAALVFMGSGRYEVKAANTVPQEDGVYSASVNMYQDGKAGEALSMSAGLFAARTDIVIEGNDANLTLYVANPIPMFVDLSAAATDGVVKDFVATVNGASYNGSVVCDPVEANRPVKLFDKASMGTVIGESYPCDVITLTVPKTALKQDHIDLSAYVNVVMMSTVDFDLVLNDYDGNVGSGENEVDPETKPTTVTATVPANEFSYTVTVPETIALGELSRSEDTVKQFEVTVNMTAGAENKLVTVETGTTGQLLAEGDTIEFSNTFGIQNFTETGSRMGTLTVEASAVSGVRANTYTGTIVFSITSK